MCDFCVCVTDRKMSDVCLHVLLREKEREKHVSYILALLCEYKMLPMCQVLLGARDCHALFMVLFSGENCINNRLQIFSLFCNGKLKSAITNQQMLQWFIWCFVNVTTEIYSISHLDWTRYRTFFFIYKEKSKAPSQFSMKPYIRSLFLVAVCIYNLQLAAVNGQWKPDN